MRMHITYKNSFKNLPVNASKALNLGLYTEILESIHSQLMAIMSMHSRVSVLRFDLHFPRKSYSDAKLENSVVSSFLKRVKDHLRSSKWGKHKHIVTGAVREVGTSKSGHYHVFIAFKAIYRRLGAFSGEGHSGLWGLLETSWKSASGGSIHFSLPHLLNRGDHTAFARCFRHLSYLAKVRDKHFGTGEHHKRFFFTRLKIKKAEATAIAV
ncbi:inovirus-type Gp2 protein [Pseudomonas sp. 9Ag]|uniref:YagK/YfjJ domain-containing protein n=1 Tax=Pseudomonas sp. 9Ag TaxID=2653167 RepID=UPI0012EF7421|nr:inovirus-type Gp2 protein [Pseudomonas sp. 9Ag]VXC99181.1 conserved hypothetical protein [Pseudomonas sp. 9Ag]